MFLYEKINAVKEFSPDAYRELPEYVTRGLNPAFELRPYQEEAFRNFITCYEGDNRPNPTQVLFHMATGSDFGYNAAIYSVKIRLGKNLVGQTLPPVPYQCDRSLIAGGFHR